MGIELRHRSPEAASRSLATVLVRQARERLLARLGIADQDADAARLIRERALAEAVCLILRVEAASGEKRGKRRRRRLADRLHQALERADADGDPLQDELLLRKLATRKQARDLASLTLPPRWHAPDSYTARDVRQSRPRAGSPKGAEAMGRSPSQDAGSDEAVRVARPDSMQRAEDSARPHPSEPVDEQPHQTARPTPGSPSRAEPGRRPPEDRASAWGDASGQAPGRRKRKRAARKKRVDRMPRASPAVIIDFTRRMYEETGSVSRDRVEVAVRAAGYTVSSDDAGRIVREFKAQLNAAQSGSTH